MDIVLTAEAEDDLRRLPDAVVDTFFSKLESIEKNLGIGATPNQAFDKYLSGSMHPCLQINLGRDYRAWFVEEKYLGDADDKIFCVKILSKKEAQKLSRKIIDFRDFAQNLS